MAKPKLYAVVYCFHKTQRDYQGDGSVGVAIFNRPHKRVPTQQEIDDTCTYACDQIEMGELAPGQMELLWTKEPTPDVVNRDTKEVNPETLAVWCQDKFQVGLWLAGTLRAPHATVQR